MIVLVNDDGIDAPGMRPLYRALRKELGQSVLAVAPAVQRSGHGHAITLERGLSIMPRLDEGFFAFAIDGTPTDCCKLALKLLAPVTPRLVVSGINDGPNVGRSIFYSGTVGAAMEAAVEGFPALAVSLDREGEQDWEAAARTAARMAKVAMSRRDLRGKVLNLNLPGLPPAAWKELKIVPHGLSGFEESYTPRKRDNGDVTWRLTGRRIELENEGETDAHALRAGHPTCSVLVPDHNPGEAMAKRLAERLLGVGAG